MAAKPRRPLPAAEEGLCSIRVAALEKKIAEMLDRQQSQQHYTGPSLHEEAPGWDLAHRIVEATVGDAERIYVAPKGDPLLERTLEAVVRRIPDVVSAREEDLARSSQAQIDALLTLLLPADPVANARKAIEFDNAKLRASFLRDIPCYTSRELAELAGHKAANASATGARWKQQGRIFSVPREGTELYPAFQFQDGQPRPAVARVLATLPKTMTPWQTAFWFVAENGWLAGARPYDRLDDPDGLVAAAEHENETFAT